MTATTAPSVPTPSPVVWARKNLFNTWYNALLTVVLVVPLAWIGFRVVRFIVVSGRWTAVRVNLTTIMAGLYPRDQMWREWVAFALTMAAVGVMVGASGRLLRQPGTEVTEEPPGVRARAFVGRAWPLLLLVIAVLGFSQSVASMGLTAACLAAGWVGWAAGRRLPPKAARYAAVYGLVGVAVALAVLVGTGQLELRNLGGLTLTLFLASSAIVLSFPLGVLAALGRRSSFPAFAGVSIAYIEFIRGVPLIMLLFMGDIGLRFFVPEAFVPPKVVAAIIMMTLFTGAYVAEIVRGGLQSIPRGQVEAGQALGLPPLKVLRKIVLPQALRNVIPALVGQFISIFKDTSLVLIIGLTDTLGVLGRVIPNQPAFLGQGILPELLGFAAFIYWAFAYTMSRESQRLERRLGVGER